MGDHFSAGYAASNVTLSGGQVHLRTDHVANAGKQYRSAGISTFGTYQFTGGRIMKRARIGPGLDGIWPAIWMIATDSGDNALHALCEYDLMEYAGGSEDVPTGTRTVPLPHHDWTAGNWQSAKQPSAHD